MTGVTGREGPKARKACGRDVSERSCPERLYLYPREMRVRVIRMRLTGSTWKAIVRDDGRAGEHLPQVGREPHAKARQKAAAPGRSGERDAQALRAFRRLAAYEAFTRRQPSSRRSVMSWFTAVESHMATVSTRVGAFSGFR